MALPAPRYNPYPGNSGRLPPPPRAIAPPKPPQAAAPKLPPALPYPGYLNPGQQLTQAKAAAAAAYEPQVAQIKQAIADETARTAQRAELIRGLYAQLAGIQGNAGQNISSIYSNAANNQSTFAKGYSDAMQQMIGGNTGQTNATLDLIGAPQGQHISDAKATAAGDVLYGLGGAIPATALNREGAAFGAAAAMTPGATFGLGMINIQQLENTSAITQNGYVAQLKTLAATEAGQIPSLLGQIQADQFKRFTTFTAAKQKAFDSAWAKANQLSGSTGYLYVVTSAGVLKRATDATGKPIRTLAGQSLDERTAAAQQAAWDRTHISPYQQAQLDQRDRLATQSGNLRIQIANQTDARGRAIANANLTARQQATQTGQLNKGGYWIDPSGKIQLQPGYKINPATGKVEKAKPGSGSKPLTFAQTRAAKTTAANYAAQSFNGYYVDLNDPSRAISTTELASKLKLAGISYATYNKASAVVPPGATLSPKQLILKRAGLDFQKRGYQETMSYLLAHGVPLAIAQQALNRYWTKPGAGGRPTVPYQQRQAAVQNAKFEITPSARANPRAIAAANLASKYLGDPYHWSGRTPATGFDCSGFVQWLYGQEGIRLGDTTYQQIKQGVPVARNQLIAGDIIFFGSAADPHHEALYLGDGLFIHSPHTGDVIKISSLSEQWYAQHFVTARRVAYGTPGTPGYHPPGTASAGNWNDAYYSNPSNIVNDKPNAQGQHLYKNGQWH